MQQQSRDQGGMSCLMENSKGIPRDFERIGMGCIFADLSRLLSRQIKLKRRISRSPSLNLALR